VRWKGDASRGTWTEDGTRHVLVAKKKNEKEKSKQVGRLSEGEDAKYPYSGKIESRPVLN